MFKHFTDHKIQEQIKKFETDCFIGKQHDYKKFKQLNFTFSNSEWW